MSTQTKYLTYHLRTSIIYFLEELNKLIITVKTIYTLIRIFIYEILKQICCKLFNLLVSHICCFGISTSNIRV
nr:MAG TPA: hypothetical protein [Caudoviricetes sp.]